MQVELYSEQETNTNNKEEMELHLELAKELGLEKQEKLHSEKGVNGYRKMTGEELFVFSVNFPDLKDIAEYTSLVPIRMLNAIKEFKKIHPNLKIILMCPEPGKPDPIVLGSAYAWNVNDGLLIGRFGEALEEFSVLKARAMENIQKKLKLFDLFSFQQLSAINQALK